jgi:hypothetical protein
VKIKIAGGEMYHKFYTLLTHFVAIVFGGLTGFFSSMLLTDEKYIFAACVWGFTLAFWIDCVFTVLDKGREKHLHLWSATVASWAGLLIGYPSMQFIAHFMARTFN